MPNTERLVLEARRAAKPLALLMGLFAAALLVIGILAKNFTFQRPWESYRTVHAQFDDVKGIFPGGHQVRIHGVKVGIVTKSELKNGRPVLTLKIEKKWGPIYKNAKLRIRPVTPLQDLYVNITDRGTPSAGEVGKNDLITAAQTVTPVDVSRVLDSFDADTRQRLSFLLDGLGKGLGENGGQKLRTAFSTLAPFLHVANDATKVLAERKVEMQRVIHNFGRLSAALAKRDDDLNKFVVQGNQTLGELARNDQPLSATIRSISELVPVMRTSFASLQTLSGHLDPALRSLEPVTQQLRSGLASLQQFGTDATPALRDLRPAARDLRTMARQLPSTAKSLATVFDRLDTQAPQFDHITSLLAPCMDTLTRFSNQTMSVLKFTDANGAFPRADEVPNADAIGGEFGSKGVPLKLIPNCTDGK